MAVVKRILIVDDEAQVCSALGEALEAAGYVTETVATGRQCLEAIGAKVPDLIALDIGLPDLDGWQVLGRLNDLGYDIPVLIISGDAYAGFKPLDFNLTPGDNYLAKPFDLAEFLARVDALCRRPARRRRRHEPS